MEIRPDSKRLVGRQLADNPALPAHLAKTGQIAKKTLQKGMPAGIEFDADHIHKLGSTTVKTAKCAFSLATLSEAHWGNRHVSVH